MAIGLPRIKSLHPLVLPRVGKVIPELVGKLTGMAFHVPTPNVLAVDLTCCLRKLPNTMTLRRWSSRHRGPPTWRTRSSLVTLKVIPTLQPGDTGAGVALNNYFVKLISWYDNEFSYSNRVVDFMVPMASKD
ncbi:Glyceraldehyde-3-phosphate dehydrogenase [Sciurus carolinensis]|uniref:glyceraldehyde-3-phosphate dehydrogenase (phosphorylating) n=1 Tax=Sciurus carolinensis TaxID=30640 RepID=A0AA41SP36_SCICA|nr:Glyceraldehyde-3-phosphate dehydrogenase [Sciurus carolinensis]